MDAHEKRRILAYVGLATALFAAIVTTGLTLLMAVGGESASEALYRTLGAFTTASIVTEPDSAGERAISAGLAIAGGLFYLFLVGFVVREVAVRRLLSQGWQFREQRRRIGGMKDHYIICGYGNVGRAVTRVLLGEGCSVVVIDMKQENLDAARDEATRIGRGDQLVGVVGEASRSEVLESANIAQARALIACVGTDGENLFIALAARDKARHVGVIVRAADHEGAQRLRNMSDEIDAVCDPYTSAGHEIARLATKGSAAA